MIKIVVGNMFDYPSTFLLVGSNVRGHCEKSTSLVSQSLKYLAPEELAEYQEDLKKEGKYGDVVFYSMKEGAPFETLLIGYPGTGHQETFEEMIANAVATITVFGFQGMKPAMTMPLIGTNVGGLSLEEWAEGFNKAIARSTKNHTKASLFVEDITIVCKTQEQADYLSKTILPYPEVV